LDELTPDQRQELRAALDALSHELTALVNGTAETVRPVDLEEPIGRISRMDAIQQQRMARAARDRHSHRLRLVQVARQRTPEEYGICRLCDDPIRYARLKIQPEATLCIACQSERERQM